MALPNVFGRLCQLIVIAWQHFGIYCHPRIKSLPSNGSRSAKYCSTRSCCERGKQNKHEIVYSVYTSHTLTYSHAWFVILSISYKPTMTNADMDPCSCSCLHIIFRQSTRSPARVIAANECIRFESDKRDLKRKCIHFPRRTHYCSRSAVVHGNGVRVRHLI